MEKYEILQELKKHGIFIVSNESEGIIYTIVYCRYWVDKFHAFPSTHNAFNFSLDEASLYFIDKVLKMSGLSVQECLK